MFKNKKFILIDIINYHLPSKIIVKKKCGKSYCPIITHKRNQKVEDGLNDYLNVDIIRP